MCHVELVLVIALISQTPLPPWLLAKDQHVLHSSDPKGLRNARSCRWASVQQRASVRQKRGSTCADAIAVQLCAVIGTLQVR